MVYRAIRTRFSVHECLHRALTSTCVLRTLKVFRSGESTDYAGPRKADGIVSYMTKCVLSVSARKTRRG